MNKPKILYIADPICGWCYGFSPVITQLEKKFYDRFDFKMICGGLVLGDRVGTIDEKFSFIKSASNNVTDYTRVEFGEDYRKNILENSDTYVFDSVPPCIAIVIFREMLPSSTIEFVAAMQKALYFDGKSLNDPKTYIELFEHFGLSPDDYLSKADLAKYKEMAFDDFREAKHLGINGFPAMILQKDDKFYSIARGYTNFDTLDEILSAIE